MTSLNETLGEKTIGFATIRNAMQGLAEPEFPAQGFPGCISQDLFRLRQSLLPRLGRVVSRQALPGPGRRPVEGLLS